MPMEKTIELVESLRQFQLLEPSQIEETTVLASRSSDPKSLARELLQRGWLTAFQVNNLFQGKGEELILGGYVLLERIGQGGMGQVFKARQKKLGRIVALKIVHKQRLNHPDAVRRFQREIEAASQLEHPNIVRAFDADNLGETHFFAMEFVDGMDLAKVVKKLGALPVLEACNYIRQAALGLQHAFERGYIHRDIKPANLLLTNQGKIIKILDMGLARPDFSQDDSSTLTQEGSVMGTPDYIAPEQARDSHSVDIRADIYSLGCTLFYLLTARVPFPGGTLTEKLLKHQMDRPTPVRSLRPEVTPVVEAVLNKMLAKKPEERFQTPAPLAAVLQDVVQGKPNIALESLVPTAAALPAAGNGTMLETVNPFAGLGGQDTLGDAPVRPAPAPPAKPAIPPVVKEKAGQVLKSVGAGLKLLAPKVKPLLGRLVILKQKPYSWIAAGVGALLMITFVGCLMFRSGPKKNDLPGKNSGPGAPKASPLDKLDPTKIPAAEQYPWLPKEVVALVGESRGRHAGGMHRLALSNDGKTLVSTGRDGSVFLWEPETLRLKARLPKVSYWTVPVVFSNDDQFCYIGCSDQTVRRWSIRNDPPLENAAFAGHAGPVLALALSPDGKTLASGGNDRSVTLWDVSGAEGKSVAALKDLGDEVWALAFSPDGKTLAVGDSRKVHLLDVTAPEPKKKTEIANLGGRVMALKYTRNGQSLVVGELNQLHVFDVTVAPALERFKATTSGNIHTVSLSRDENWVACACDHAEGQFIDIASAKQKKTKLPAVFRPVQGIVWAADGQSVISGHGDTTLRRWTWNAPGNVDALGPPLGHPSAASSLAFSADNQTLATGGGPYDRVVQLWNVGVSPPAPGPELDSSFPAHAVAYSPDGKFLAAGVESNFVLVWDLAKKAADHPMPLSEHLGTVKSLAFSPDSKVLAAGDAQKITLWEMPKAKKKAVLSGHEQVVNSLSFTPDGKTLASGSNDATIRTWDIGGKEPSMKLSFPAKSGFVLQIQYLGEKLLVSAGSDRSIRAWDPNDGLLAENSFKGTKDIASLALSADGKHLAAADRSGYLVVWSTDSDWKKEWKFEVPLHAVAFAPDGRHLAIAADNSAIYILRLFDAPHDLAAK